MKTSRIGRSQSRLVQAIYGARRTGSNGPATTGIPMDKAASAAEFAHLPPTLRAERQGAVAVLKLARPEKRNALDDATVLGIEAFFSSIPDGIGAVVLAGEGDNFSAGLDLAELAERDVTAGIEHSRFWHRVFEKIEFGKARWSAAAWKSRRRATCGWPSARRSMRCPKPAAAFSSVAAVQCACRR